MNSERSVVDSEPATLSTAEPPGQSRAKANLTDPYRRLASFVSGRASLLMNQSQSDNGAAKASLARLRRSAAADIASTPDIWPIVFDGFPNELAGHTDNPSRFEQACHTALTLFALHQQSRSDAMHVPGVGLGSAIRKIADPTDTSEHDQAVMRRYQVLVTSTDFEELRHHLRGIVQLLRDRSVPLDYGRLAADLARVQSPTSMVYARLQWARDLHSLPRKNDADTSSPSSQLEPEPTIRQELR